MKALKTLCMLWLALNYTTSIHAQYEGDLLFDESFVHEIKITVPISIDDMFQIHFNNFQQDQPYTLGEVEIDGILMDSVGVRVKGGLSAFDPKRPLKLDFNEFVSGQKFDGLQKVNLQQGNMEESFMREAVCYNIMRLAGVKAPRTSFANVYVNGVFEGVYTLVEQIDDNFIKNRFASDKGTLYKTGESGTTLGVKFEDDHSLTFADFETAVQQIPDNVLHEQLYDYLDIESFFRYIAANLFVSAVDSYLDVNYNYYVYYEPKSATYVFIPWDYNLSYYGAMFDIIPNFNAHFLFDKTMANPVLEERYLEIFCELLTYNFDDNRIQNLINQYADLLEPHLPSDPYINDIGIFNFTGDWADGVDRLRTNVSNNYNHFMTQMADNPYNCTPLTNPIPPNAIVINEIVASNDSLSNVTDQNGESADWIELYNNTANPIALDNCYLSNDKDVLKHWRFPDNTIVPANGYLIVWADRDIHQNGVHVDFKLKKSQGELLLSFENGEILDQVAFSNQTTNVGYARVPNGTGSFVQQAATFNATNDVTYVPTPIGLTYTDITNPSCPSSSDGAIEIGINGGTPPYSYLWSNGAASEDIYNLTAGFYTLTVTDSDAAMASFSFQLMDPDMMELTVVCTNETAENLENGTAEVQVSGGVGPYDFQWSNGSNLQFIIYLSPDDYCVTVTDDNGCVANACCTVNTSNCNITTNINDIGITCNGAADGILMVEVQNAIPPLTYAWSSGGTSDTENNISAGTYTVTVTDALGCQSISSKIVSEPDPLVISITNPPELLSCNVSEVTVDFLVEGGTPPYTYESNPIFSVSGIYTIQVEDSQNCTAQVMVEIMEENHFLTVNSAAFTTDCFGENVILSDIDINGSHPPFVYIWTTNDNGLVDLMVIDELGCTATFGPFTLTVLEIPNVTATITNLTSAGNDGAIDLNITGGTMPYTFVWDNGAMTKDIMNLEAGDYSVTITDANGCQQNYTYTIDVYTSIENVELVYQIELFPNPSQGFLTLSINNYANEKIQIDVFNTNGQKVKQYQNVSLQNEQYRMNWQDLVDSLFFVKITFDDKVITKKIMLAK